MKFITINPATEEIIKEHETMPMHKVLNIAEKSHNAFLAWRELKIEERASYLIKLAESLRNNKQEYSEYMTEEMGKPIRDSLAEVEKCAWAADVYAEKGPEWLKDEPVEVDGKKHLVTYQPLGVILSIMPWNFPFWQALRFAIPTILAGNGSLLKHASNVTQSALTIEQVFKEAGFPENLFRTVIADHKSIAGLAASDYIQGISLTGSTSAGSRIGETAGKNIKRVVLELGGSDPFIVLDDADPEIAAGNAVLGRAQNCGQSCIAAKRFIVTEKIAKEFTGLFGRKMAALKIGDPMDKTTQIGPLVNKDALEEMEMFVEDAKAKGAAVVCGGERILGKGYFYKPTVLSNTTPDMKVVSEEVFGPIAPVMVVKDAEEALKVANSSEFGLGGSIWTRDLRLGENLARRLESGTVFVNSITRSDPRMPFGGIKKSGIGRELSKYGLKEFVNIKGVNIYEHF
ncbi:MAG: NAD-dependent succinate-semialdehyde dehydrogenase [bacterium]